MKKNFFNDLIIERVGPAKLWEGEYWYVGIRRKSDAEQQELLGDEE